MSKKYLVYGILAAMLVSLVIWRAQSFTASASPSPEKTLNEFFNLLVQADYQAASLYLADNFNPPAAQPSAPVKGVTPRQQLFIDYARQVRQTRGPITKFTVKPAQIDKLGQAGPVLATCSFNLWYGDQEYAGETMLTDHAGRWEIGLIKLY